MKRRILAGMCVVALLAAASISPELLVGRGISALASVSVEAPPAGSPVWSTVLWTATGAVLAALVTATLTRSTKISEFRQLWINSLRDDIAELIGEARACNEAALAVSEQFKAVGKDALKDRYWPSQRRARTLMTRISLRINPLPNDNSAEDEAFLLALRTLVDHALRLDKPASTLDPQVEEAERLSRLLLKREWQATKRRLFS